MKALLLRRLPPQKLEEDTGHSLRLSWLGRSNTNAFYWLLGRTLNCFLSLEVKAQRLILVLPNKTIEIPLAQLREVTFSIPPEGAGLLLVWIKLRYQENSQEKSLWVPLWVDGLNRRQEAMDLVFRIAQAWGLVGYQLIESREELSVSLLQEVPEGAEPYRSQTTAGVYRVPLLKEAADYHSDEPPPKSSEQEAFDWSRFGKKVVFVLLVIGYTLLWALAGLPGGAAAVLVLMLFGVFFDLMLWGVGGSTPFSNFMNSQVAGYSMMEISLWFGLVLGFIWSVVTAVRWAREEH